MQQLSAISRDYGARCARLYLADVFWHLVTPVFFVTTAAALLSRRRQPGSIYERLLTAAGEHVFRLNPRVAVAQRPRVRMLWSLWHVCTQS